MTPFSYSVATDVDDASTRLGQRAHAAFIAGGTDLIQLMQERVVEPRELVYIGDLPLRGITVSPDGSLRIGALAKLADVAADAAVAEKAPLIVQSLLETASPQVRRMATIGGNLLQRTRCLYFRDRTTPCNKREPGSGCSALEGQNRINAILGGSEHCIATHASDLAVALLALDANLVLRGTGGERTVPLADFYSLPADRPHVETVLRAAEIIVEVHVPAHDGRRARYLKVRDRASFEWALTSCAVSLDLDGENVADARTVAGGVGTVPWRLRQVEEALVGRPLTSDVVDAAAAQAVEGAEARGHNGFKIPLLQRTIARALMQAGAAP